MERGDLLEANGAIFTAQGKALNEVAADDVRIGVTGNPANTNALIAMSNAPDIPTERFSALTRLDHNRAISQLAAKTGAPVTDIKKMTIWGNHSATQYPDIFHAEVGGKNAAEVVGRPGLDRERLHPDRRQARRRDHRGPRLVVRRLRRLRDRSTPRATGCTAPPTATGSRWRSSPTARTASPRAWSPPSRSPRSDGDWEIVQGLEIDDFSRGRMDATAAELAEERDAVKELGLI